MKIIEVTFKMNEIEEGWLRSSYKETKWTISFIQAVGDSGLITFTEAIVWHKSIAEARQNENWSLPARLVNLYENNTS